MGAGLELTSPSPPVTKTHSNFRWAICLLLFFATTINYIDRQILSLIKPILDDQLHWTDTQFGAVNSAFQAAYAVSLLFFGWFIDKYGTRIGYAVSIAAWSLAAAGHALVGSIGGFVIARVALGLGEGGNFPAAIKATAQWFPKRERAFATSLFNSGANVGAILAPAAVPAIALHLGWHWAFIFAGAAGFVWVAVWLSVFGLPRQLKQVSPEEIAHIESDQDQTLSNARIPWVDVLKYRQAWGFVCAKFLTDPVWWFFLIWLPDFFKKTRGMDIKHSWTLLVTIYSIVTVLSIAGGWLTGRLASRGWTITRARKTTMLLYAALVVPISLATHVDNWTAVLLIGLAGAAHQAWSANLYTTVSDVFPRRAIASVIGLGSMAGSIGGILFPLLTGYTLDHLPKTGYGVIFGLCGCAYLVAFGVQSILSPTFEPALFPDPKSD